MKQTHTYTLVAATMCLALVSTALLPSAAALTMLQEKSIAGIPTTITLQDVPSTASELALLPPFGAEETFALNGGAVQSVRIPGTSVQIAGEYRLAVLSGNNVLQDGVLTVSPSSFSAEHSSLSSNATDVEPSGQSSITITVTAQDEFGNVLSNRPMQVISNRNSETITPVERQTNTNGDQTFTVRTVAPGSFTLRALDLITGDTLANSLTINQSAVPYGSYGGPNVIVQNTQNPYSSPFAGNTINYATLYGQAANFEEVHRFEITTDLAVQVNTFQSVTITAKDINGVTVEDFEGMVELASSDPAAALPAFGMVQFTAADLGTKQLVLGLRFGTPGTHILYAELATNPDINGKTDIEVLGTNTLPVVTQKISIFSPAPGAVLNASQELVLKGKGPAFSNLVISGGQFDTVTETDGNGNFTATVALKSGDTHVLRIKNDAGTADSGEITIYTDTVAPEITSITFDPIIPVANQDVLIQVQVNEIKDKMREVTMSINETTIVLQSTDEKLYEYVYTPKEPGMLTVKVTATDKAGNQTESQSMVEVQKPVVPGVQNLRGLIEENIAILQWDPIRSGIDKYRIYIGDKESGNYAYSLETTLTEAKVNGLAAGATYYVIVVGVEGNRESANKGTELVLQSPKTLLKATPGNSEVLLEWQSPVEEASIATWRLRFGTQADNLIEERILNGKLRRFTVSDLINEKMYYFELVPITITGQLLENATTVADATPTGNGLHGGAPDPIPANILAGLGKGKGKGKGPVVNPDIVPDQPTTGAMTVPSVILGALLVCIGYFILLKRREQKLQRAFLHQVQDLYTNA